VLERRCRRLLDRNGGGWLGPLWRWFPPAACWHRGLLTLRVPRRFDATLIEEMACWVDTLLFRLTGRDSLRRAAGLICRTGVNHAGLDLHHALSEQAMLSELACLPELPDLRTLSIDWALRQLSRVSGKPPWPSVSVGFLTELVSLPFARHLSRLGSSWPF